MMNRRLLQGTVLIQSKSTQGIVDMAIANYKDLIVCNLFFLVFIFYVINTHLISLFANQTLPFISRIQYKKVKYIEGEMEQGLNLYPHNTDVSIPFVSTLESH